MSLYIISDLHFDDKWICNNHRPFNDLKEMNKALLSNCKSQIDEEDTFLFLGDIVGEDTTKDDVWEWYGKLTEIDHWVPGNHDHVPKSEYDETTLPVQKPFFKELRKKSFLFKHKPYRKEGGDHWIIHGHKHNEKPEEYPFIDPENRRVNVSASMLRYKPIAMEDIIELIETEQRYRFAPENR